MPLVPPTTTAVRPLRSNKDISWKVTDGRGRVVKSDAARWRRVSAWCRLAPGPGSRLAWSRCACMASPRRLGIAGPDGLVDPPVRFRRVAVVALAGARRGVAAPLVIQRRHHLDQRRHDRIARRRRDAAMEVDVVHQEHARILERGEQAGDLVGQRRELIGRRAFGRETGRADLEDAARLVHLLAREAVQRRLEAERFGAERRRAVGDVGARSRDARSRRPSPAARAGRRARWDG